MAHEEGVKNSKYFMRDVAVAEFADHVGFTQVVSARAVLASVFTMCLGLWYPYVVAHFLVD